MPLFLFFTEFKKYILFDLFEASNSSDTCVASKEVKITYCHALGKILFGKLFQIIVKDFIILKFKRNSQFKNDKMVQMPSNSNLVSFFDNLKCFCSFFVYLFHLYFHPYKCKSTSICAVIHLLR